MKTLEQLGISPAPWKHNIENKRDYKLFSVEAEDGSVMAYFDCCEEQFNLYEGFANSRLIAAAPKLYAACYEMLRYYYEQNTNTTVFNTALELMKQAVAEAAGESEAEFKMNHPELDGIDINEREA